MTTKQNIIGIIGLGYVGLPLAAALSKKHRCIGFDISMDRIKDLNNCIDKTGEMTSSEIKNLTGLTFTGNENDLKICNFFIVTVPTPINKHKVPDFGPLESASELIGRVIKKDNIVVYESTVYPGATEEKCIPIIEKHSGLVAVDEFLYGYSPERINPGDKSNSVENIVKVTSGCNDIAAKIIDDVYASIITAGTYKASSVRVAEAAKVIENAQRDVNIAFMNQISMIFGKLDINTNDVIEAASTKWNFLKFSPGLVGGHCIGVDPYYLIAKSEEVGCDAKMLKVARDINEGMPQYILEKIKSHTKNNKTNLSVLILGATFKENCPDLRNSKVKELYDLLFKSNYQTRVIDSVADKSEMSEIYKGSFKDDINKYDVIILSVPHDSFFKNSELIYLSRLKKGGIIFDVKSKIDNVQNDAILLQL